MLRFCISDDYLGSAQWAPILYIGELPGHQPGNCPAVRPHTKGTFFLRYLWPAGESGTFQWHFHDDDNEDDDNDDDYDDDDNDNDDDDEVDDDDNDDDEPVESQPSSPSCSESPPSQVGTDLVRKPPPC